METSGFRVAVDSRLLAVGQHLRQREQHRLELASYSAVDYKPGAAGAEMARLLGDMKKDEISALSDLVLLRDDVAAYCRATGNGNSDLSVVVEFHAFRSAKTIVSGCSNTKHSYALVKRAGDGPAGRDSIHDARFFVELGTYSYQVLELVHDLLQFWEIFLRHHTTLDLRKFSMEVQAGLLGRITDTVFYQGVARQLIPVPEPAPASASVEVLQAEILRRLGNVAFYLEEREILRPGLAKYTGKTFCDPSNENAKRDATRIRNVETSILHELVHLADSVRKWLEKQGRASELAAVVERFRPYRVGAEPSERAQAWRSGSKSRLCGYRGRYSVLCIEGRCGHAGRQRSGCRRDCELWWRPILFKPDHRRHLPTVGIVPPAPLTVVTNRIPSSARKDSSVQERPEHLQRSFPRGF